MLGMHPPFFQGVLVPLNMTNPVRFMTNPCLTNPLFKNKMTKFLFFIMKLINLNLYFLKITILATL